MSQKTYVGGELELFAKAYNWKKYYASLLKKYLKGKVLEVGAGIGGTTIFLCNGSQDKWVCLEPDSKLAKKIKLMVKNKHLPDYCELVVGTLSDIPKKELFDAIVYIDVIEHIEDDARELELAVQHLAPNGFLIIMVPAHQWLGGPFDKAIGHHRRYNKKMLKSIIPSTFKQKKLVYLDSVGILASLSNKILLKQDYPTEKQVLFWDRIMVRLSRFTDKFLIYLLGKEVLGVWQKKPV